MKQTQANEKPNKKRKKKKKSLAGSIVATVILIVAVCVFCFAGYKLITIGVDYGTASSAYGNIQDLVAPPDKVIEIPETNAEGETYNPDDIDPEFLWDYDALCKVNSDCIGWIKMRGKSTFLVNYPVVQCDNNDYYLEHLFDRTPNPAGTIFMDFDAKNQFEEPYTYLYGHNMAQGSRMFGYLKQYEKEAFFKEHKEMDIYTPDKHYIYKVFATYIEYETGLTYTTIAQYIDEKWTEEEKEKELLALAKYALDKAQYKTGVTMDAFDKDSHILALSTCYGNYSDPRRYIIMLVRDREVPIEPNLAKTSK